ncbi:hypothetical protein RHA1_ro08332 (plasmid) [Rhodococcus jostii RHA1]|uniref:Uncharacterized protein n=1 Tax=Rhodococcus jostii (strain RHA1) TaxID=101510 RepID=Q0RZB0_RHOJR|nr:hypothetical protein RHA1_ro08332 [Rhodococcus jostii RHA1]
MLFGFEVLSGRRSPRPRLRVGAPRRCLGTVGRKQVGDCGALGSGAERVRRIRDNVLNRCAIDMRLDGAPVVALAVLVVRPPRTVKEGRCQCCFDSPTPAHPGSDRGPESALPKSLIRATTTHRHVTERHRPPGRAEARLTVMVVPTVQMMF